MRVVALPCGWLTADLGLFLNGESGSIRVPVPAILVEHPRGRALFDSGLHPTTATDPHDRLGPLADVFHVDQPNVTPIDRGLAALDLRPDDVDLLVNSHLHFDHAGGNELVPNARLVVQRREWEAAGDPDLASANGFRAQDFDHGHDVLTVDGEHDLFGDGSVTLVPTYGHTPGHQSLRIRAGQRDIVFTADACYLRQSLERLLLTPILHDAEAMRATFDVFRSLQAGGAELFFGHDPAVWDPLGPGPSVLLDTD